jgi:CarboxypepD_reg-like domain
MRPYNPIIILIFFLLSFTVNAQQGVLQGRIFNTKNNAPVEFATVAIYGTSIGSISDLDGNFLFTGLEPGYIELRVSSIGFETYIS